MVFAVSADKQPVILFLTNEPDRKFDLERIPRAPFDDHSSSVVPIVPWLLTDLFFLRPDTKNNVTVCCDQVCTFVAHDAGEALVRPVVGTCQRQWPVIDDMYKGRLSPLAGRDIPNNKGVPRRYSIKQRIFA